MIVPRNRLLLWTGLVLVPVLGLAPLHPSAVAAVAGAAVAVALLDALVAAGRPRAIRITAPATVRAARGRPVPVACRIASADPSVRRVRMALALPEGLCSEVDELDVRLPEDAETAQIDFPLTGRRTGCFDLGPCCMEAPSPLGLWGARRRVPLETRVRVYPNLAREYRRLSCLLSGAVSGIHARRQLGRGREFEQLRDYLPGDGYEDIHWKATARMGRPVTKVHQIERTQEIYVAVDLSRLSGRPAEAASRGEPESGGNRITLADRYITAALVLAMAAEKQGDLFGLVTFTDGVQRFLRARGGKAHYRACLDALYDQRPVPVTPDFNGVFGTLAGRLSKRAYILFLTSLDDPVLAEGFARNAAILSRKHLVQAGMIRPDGAAPLFSSPDVSSVEDVYRALAGHTAWERLNGLRTMLARQGAGLGLFASEALCTELVAGYLAVKQRQLL
jgi:uncharacterized protein (DUF58 family)